MLPLLFTGSEFIGTFAPTPTQLAQLRNGEYYVNIHSTAFPGGEVRGQFGSATIASTFGWGCAVQTGTRPEAGVTGVSAAGTVVEYDLFGGVAGGAGFLALSLNRTSSAVGPLPLAFGTLGLPAPCHLQVNPQVSTLDVADAKGCIKRVILFGYTAGVIGFRVFAQWLLLAPGANPAGVAASNGVEITLQ